MENVDMKKIALILAMMAVFTTHLSWGQTMPLESGNVPQPFKVSREGIEPQADPGPVYSLNLLKRGTDKPVFNGCRDNAAYVAFQLFYDVLAHGNTTIDWTLDVNLALLHGEDTVWNRPLHLEMADQTFIATLFHDEALTCLEDYHFAIASKDSTGTMPSDFIDLKLLYYDKISDPFVPSTTFPYNCAYNQVKHETALSWSFPSGQPLREFDVEWVFIDSADLFTGDAEAAFAQREPVRVTTPGSTFSYDHQVYYPSGKIWYRIRAVGYNLEYPAHRVPGNWQYMTPGIVINNHQKNMTWQEQIVYAEEGKSKRVVSYFDENLRQRQALTNLSSQQTTLVSEALYDFEGRKVVDILPVPAKDNLLTYHAQFHDFQSVDAIVGANTGTAQQKFNYDNNRLQNSILKDAVGAGNYYSPANSFASVHKGMIPDGEGYVYNQIEYMRDGTGRVSRQSGVGKEFRHDGNHTTRYFYAGATKTELKRLFGSNVGNAAHYKKNMVVDPNGQVSVSYLDQEGRVIATALAGDVPSNVDSLASYKNLVLSPVTEVLNEKNGIDEGVSVTRHGFLNVAPNTVYTFHYDLSAMAAEVESARCLSCAFDLHITLTDADGSLVQLPANIPGNQSTDALDYRRDNITAADCNNPTTINDIEFQVTLSTIGDYTITKTLTPHEMSFTEIRTELEQDSSTQVLMQQIRDSYMADPTDCEICTETCDEAEAYVEEAIDEIVALDCENILRQIEQYYIDLHPNDADYSPDQSEIANHPLYCKYLLCAKDQQSDAFDKRMARVESWGGMSNPLEEDPFFNIASLSGASRKSDMQHMLDNTSLGTIGNTTYAGKIGDVTNPDNGVFYVNGNGEHDAVNGKHILYLDLMSRRSELGETAYKPELDRQRWTMYRSMYEEAKRQIKLSIPEYQACPSAMEALDPYSDLASYEVEDIKKWAKANGLKESVSDAELEMSLYSITSACDTRLTPQDSATVRNNLKSYFNSDPQNILRIVQTEDVESDTTNSLSAINDVLRGYNCALDSVALENIMSCVRDTTIVLPGNIPSSAPSAFRTTMPLASKLAFSQKRRSVGDQQEELLARINQSKSKSLDSILAQAETEIKERIFSEARLNNRPELARIGTRSIVLPDQAEYAALIALYYATNDFTNTDGDPYERTNWIDNTGWGNADPNVVEDVSGWFGVTTDDDGHVTQLKLSGNRLDGVLPPELGNLQHLKFIDMNYNQLHDSLPSEIYSLPSLEHLSLAGNKLQGTIPAQIGQLSYLTYLNLSGNQSFEGSIPLEITTLSNLVSLDLGNNELSGTIPVQIGNLSNLQSLDLSGNQLTGVIPEELGQLSNLTHLSLGNNPLHGSMPTTLANLSALQYLTLDFLDITAQVDVLTGLNNLELLGLRGISIDSIPTSIGNLSSLRILSIGFNKNIRGTIPNQIGNLSNLEVLNIAGTKVSGSIPQLNGLSKLYWLDLDDNELTGGIPASIGNTKLYYLYLDHNKLTGSVPMTLANRTLYNLLLNDNELSGVFPMGVAKSNITIGSCVRNDFTFADLMPALSSYSNYIGRYGFYPFPQDTVDIPKRIVLGGQPITFTTEIDRDVIPKCKYQWFRYVDGVNDIALTPLDTSSYSFTIASPTVADIGDYYYKIVNDNPMIGNSGLDELVLYSFFQKVDSAESKRFNLCLQYDPTNSTVQKFTVQLNLDDLVEQCRARAAHEDAIVTEYAIEQLIEDKASSFYSEFKTKCLDNVDENLEYQYIPKEYHYTLYYYDQSANLVQTVPPAGVHPSIDSEAAHSLVTRYRYNSLNQLIWQSTPDAGESNFWYNDKGQLKASRNAQQALDSAYSYTRYDALGRIVEVGEMKALISEHALKDSIQSISYPHQNAPDVLLSDITRTHYDFANEKVSNTLQQTNLRTRVSYVEVIDKWQDTTRTFYSYDIHGNVKSMLQSLPDFPFKRTDYVYDLVSGKVNYVMYQYGEPDEFIHRYDYDGDNRITGVATSSDGFIWNHDAEYSYYAHGPLARVELGEYNVQGLDYYYTLQGWIKGVNMPYEGDPGGDGITKPSGRDVYAYSLGYYNGDYKPINNSLTLSDSRDQLWPRQNELNNHSGLYNGNISWIVTDLAKIGAVNKDRGKGMQAMIYKYDQLHRIAKSRSLTEYTTANGFATRDASPHAYDEDYSYDANGNLLTLNRKDHEGNTLHDFNYEYYPNTNKLRQVGPPEDMVYNGALSSNTKLYRKITLKNNAYVPQGKPVEIRALEEIEMDPDFQAASGTDFYAHIVADSGMYQYDKIGNLVLDQQDGVKISWTPYGKVREVRSKSDSLITTFRYDGAGNRIEKKVTRTDSADITHVTRYVRDAGGNVMGIYRDSLMSEQYVYGSSRLGLYKGRRHIGQRSLGEKNYELSNHLVNVLAVITDNIGMNSEDSVWASVVSTSDYYPFGLEMEGRTWTDSTTSNKYRHGFNGKEKDGDGEFGSTTYDYGFRIYNPAIAKFLSVDPLTKDFPWYTPYQFAGNSPIEAIDLDGLEEVSNKVINDVRFVELKNVTFKMVIRQSTESLTTAMSKTVDSKLDNYSVNTQMGEPVPGTEPEYEDAETPQPNYRSQGFNIVNGKTVGGRSSSETWHMSVSESGGVTAGKGNPSQNSSFAVGGATPLYVNGLKYGETNVWKPDTPKEIDRILKGAVAPENQKWLQQKSNGVYADQNSIFKGKTVLGYNSANQHWMMVSQENLFLGGMTYDAIRDQLIRQGFDLILGFDGSDSSILLKNGLESYSAPADYKNNTMPSGMTLSVPKLGAGRKK
ncbi:RHS repeat-associated core domain-containing protein [Chryseolinea sp. T2]|uniref:leucine-rich repeat domain-containing protein n=1 Tax=Chryseolinea sp. T2 TaxID=3129255 RepID=UPI00307798E5